MRMCQRNHRCQNKAFSILRDGGTPELKTVLLTAPHNRTEMPMAYRIMNRQRRQTRRQRHVEANDYSLRYGEHNHQNVPTEVNAPGK